MIGRTNAGGGGAPNKSTIIVTAPTGSAVTCKSGSTTKTAPEKNGTWTFSGLGNGTWTITATKSGQTATKSVTISRLEVEYVTITYNQIPAFTYTGSYQTVDDNDNPITTSQGNWKIRFLTSGTLKFTDLNGAANGIDVFLLGGGGAGSELCNGKVGGGGGGGRTTTARGVNMTAGTSYPISIGSGGIGTYQLSGINGGTTSAFSYTAAGGEGGYMSDVDNGKGGDGGSGGGGAGHNYHDDNYPGGNGGVNGSNGAEGTSAAGGTGQVSTTREFADANYVTIYASGGGGGSGKYVDISANGSGVPPRANFGDGGHGENADGSGREDGSAGLVVIRNKR